MAVGERRGVERMKGGGGGIDGEELRLPPNVELEAPG